MKPSDIELPSNRKFGFFFTAIFAIAGFYIYHNSEYSDVFAYAFFLVAVFLIAVTFIDADLLLPFNKLWMRFGLLLGKVVNPIVMGIIFFALFTPISIFIRLFGRDELRLKIKNKASHWKEREDGKLQNNTFKNQF